MSHDNKGFTSDYDGEKGGNLNRTDGAVHPQQLSAASLYMTDTFNKKSSKDLEADNYDPYDHRDVPHPITNMDALFHMMKASCGTGILAMPLAFMHAGYAIGLVGTIVIGSICTYCVHILIQSEYELCRRRKIPSLTYPDIAYEAFREGPRAMRKMAPLARHSVNFFLALYQVGACGVYTVFIAQNLKEVIDQYTPEDTHLDLKIYMYILLAPLILINWVRNLKLLAPCSTFAVAITVLAFAVVLYYVFTDLPPVSSRVSVGEIQNMPLFFGTVIFALEAIGVIVPLENEMRTPQNFKGVFGVLNRGMVPIVFMYTFLGFFGYIQYGDKAEGSITLNLPNEPLGESVKVLIAVAIFGTHPLQCYVVIDIVWNTYMAPRFVKHRHVFYIEMAVRTAIVVLAFLLAVAIPNLGPFISLIGALSLSMAGIFLPSIIELATYWYQKTGVAFTYHVSKNVFLMLFAALGLVTGTISVNVFIGIYQLGTCSVYTLFIAENLKAVVDQYTPLDQHLDLKVYMCILLVPLILVNWIRNLKLLAPCSTFAVAITVLAFAVVLYYVFTDLPPVSSRVPVGELKNMPLFFGTVIFALEAIGVIIPLENDMRTPKNFKGIFGVLNRGMVPIVCLYTFLGFFGYIQYGDKAAGSVTLNLPHEPLAESVKILIAVAIFGTHPLQCYVVIDIIWNTYLASFFVKHPRVQIIEMVVRTLIVILGFLLAVAIPNLGPFISLIGALSLSMAGILLPAAIQLSTFWYERQGAAFTWILCRNVLLMLFALLGLFTGTYASILEILGHK